MKDKIQSHLIEGQFVVNCECNDPAHMLHFYYDKENEELIITTVLKTEKNIFKRIIIAIKYIFGHKRWMCEFSDTLLIGDSIKKFRDLLNQEIEK